MKNLNDILNKFKSELKQWFSVQCANPYTKFYIWYKESTDETDGDIVIADARPEGYKLASCESVRRDMTDEGNFIRNYELMRKMPVLSIMESTTENDGAILHKSTTEG